MFWFQICIECIEFATIWDNECEVKYNHFAYNSICIYLMTMNIIVLKYFCMIQIFKGYPTVTVVHIIRFATNRLLWNYNCFNMGRDSFFQIFLFRKWKLQTWHCNFCSFSFTFHTSEMLEIVLNPWEIGHIRQSFH